MSTSEGLRIRLQPKQSELWTYWDESPITRIGFGGARGGAKSGGGRRCMFLRRLKYPLTTGLILRRTYPELYKSHIVKLFEEYPETRRWYNEQRKEMIFPNGSRLFFGSAEHAKDMGAFYSAEFADIMLDEAQEFSQHEVEDLSGANRCTSNPEISPKMVFTFMPGVTASGLPPIGLPYLKRVFVDAERNPAARLPEEKRQSWAFIQAFSWDNIEWVRKELAQDGVTEEEFYDWSDSERREYFISRTEYGKTLNAITDAAKRDAWLYGKWGVFQGQFFPHFSRERHVRPDAEILAMLKPWYVYTISGDWGFDHPHSIHFHAQDEHKRVITFHELWDREVHETELGRRITAAAAGHKFRSFAFSWDAGKLSPRAKLNAPKSMMQLVADSLGTGIPKPHPADSSPGTRISGARLMSQVLESDMWLVSDACPKLIECLPTLVRDPDNTEDVLKVDFSENGIGDDPYDSARMGLQHMLGSSLKPERVLLEEKLASVRQTFARRPEGPPNPVPVADPFAAFGGKKA